jgi:hypothetical protein
MEDEVRAFLIRNTAISVIRIFTIFELDNQALIFWPAGVFLQRITQSFGANDE